MFLLLFQKPIQTARIEDVQYVFPKERKEKRVLSVKEHIDKLFENGVYRMPDSVNEILVEFLGNLYCNEELAWNYADKYVDEKEEACKKQQRDFCKYCNYTRQCRRKLGDEL